MNSASFCLFHKHEHLCEEEEHSPYENINEFIGKLGKDGGGFLSQISLESIELRSIASGFVNQAMTLCLYNSNIISNAAVSNSYK
jgi:hypothetical protein